MKIERFFLLSVIMKREVKSLENPKLTNNKQNKESKKIHFTMDRKREAVTSVVMILAAGALGYFLFVQEPLAVHNAYATGMNTESMTAGDTPVDDGNINTTKENYDEGEVAEAIANYVSSDPNIRIASQSFEEGENNLGVLILNIDHHGISGELSQYIETINSAPKSIVVDNINYMETLDGVISTEINLSIPYHKVDQSLASQSFVTEDSSVLADATNSNSSGSNGTSSNATTSKWSKPTPKTSSSASSSKSSSSSSKRTPSKVTSTAKPKPSPSQPKPSSPNVTVTDKDNPQIGQGQAVDNNASTNHDASAKAFTTPTMTPDTSHFAPPFVNYSMTENVEEIALTGDVRDLYIDREDMKADDVKEQTLKLNIQSLNEGMVDPTTNLNRVIRLSLKEFYLPKNAQTLSVTLNTANTFSGKFTLVLEDSQGNLLNLQDPEVESLDAGQERIVFKLGQMDGTIRVKSLEYEVMKKEYFNENIDFKNIEISSIEQK